MPFENIAFIAFDLDGTLLDSVPDLAIAADQTVQALGFASVTQAQVRDYVGNGADILIGRALSQSQNVSPDLDTELLARARVLFDENYQQTGHSQSHLYPKVMTTLLQLKEAGIPMALVTNKPYRFVPELLAKHGLDELFVEVIGGDTFAEKKPHPMALQHLLDKYQLDAKQLLMVGDSKNDILTAKNVGCLSFGLTYGYNHGEPIAKSGPDYVSDCLSELLELVAVPA